jgi:hypothetical protein
MKATIKLWSEVDETIQQQVGNIMTHTESPDRLPRDNTWHEAMEACCKISHFWILERNVRDWYFLLSVPVGFLYNELYKGNIKNVFKCSQRHLVQHCRAGDNYKMFLMKREMSHIFPHKLNWTPSQSYMYDFFLSIVSAIITTCWRASHGNCEVTHLYVDWPAQLEEDQCLLTHKLRAHSFHNMPVQTSSCWQIHFISVGLIN